MARKNASWWRKTSRKNPDLQPYSQSQCTIETITLPPRHSLFLRRKKKRKQDGVFHRAMKLKSKFKKGDGNEREKPMQRPRRQTRVRMYTVHIRRRGNVGGGAGASIIVEGPLVYSASPLPYTCPSVAPSTSPSSPLRAPANLVVVWLTCHPIASIQPYFITVWIPPLQDLLPFCPFFLGRPRSRNDYPLRAIQYRKNLSLAI
ncbi:hypothetical protein AMTR_s00158p00057900 [Amborella trichopoda]|uniref:Uncharacterized protein n=1 Tax=Amborella trichopoda TaxID=13333 RepID=W1PSX0_AMBTC|nr:hypothetical protein AMTR_s00158p00057900 [Amborella trichopoda]